MDIFYPVGSIYLSVNSTSPASIVGGSWTQIKGACLAATGDNGFAASGSFGGSFYISQNQLPAHAHRLSNNSNEYFCGIKSINAVSGKITTSDAGTPTDYIFGSHINSGGDWSDLLQPSTTTNVGGGKASCLVTILCMLGKELHNFKRVGDINAHSC